MLTLTVIVPAYNEARTIVEILERVKAQPLPGVTTEVIVVDDGSTDATPDLLRDRPDLYTRLLRLAKNGGKGAAVRAGLKAATGEFVLFQDADLEYSPSEYPKLVEPVLKYNADVVIGSRTLAPSCRRIHYLWNKLGNGLVTLTFNVFFNATFSDIYSCYLLFRRTLVQPDLLLTNGFDQQAEILATCVRRGTIFYEVPIDYHGRTYAEGKQIRTADVVGVLWAIVRGRFARPG